MCLDLKTLPNPIWQNQTALQVKKSAGGDQSMEHQESCQDWPDHSLKDR